jgi:hypothetical protein
MFRILYHGLTAGVMAAITAGTYYILYQELLFTEFKNVISFSSITVTSITACLIMAAGYRLVQAKYNTKKAVGWLGIVYVVLSFVSILKPFLLSLPLNVENPELFPGLAVPMHFFPVISFLAVLPFFKLEERKYY